MMFADSTSEIVWNDLKSDDFTIRKELKKATQC